MMRAHGSQALLACLLSLATLAGPAVRAETPPSDKALAAKLFRDARAAMQKKSYAKACPMFAESQRLDPTIGTLLNLAICHQQEGKTATAWAEFNNAARIAGNTGDTDRATIARDKALALESVLSMLVIDVSRPPREMEIELDGRIIGEAAWNRPLPADPGPHKLLAAAPGWAPETIEVQVPAGPSSTHVTVALHTRTAEPQRAAPTSSSSAQVPVLMPVMNVSPGGSTTSSPYRTVGWIAGAVGLAGVGVGTFFGLRALSRQGVVEDNCHGAACNRVGLDADHEAHTAATWSTVGFGVGIVGLAAGAWLLLAPPGRKTAWAVPVAGPKTAGVQLTARF